MRTRGACAKGIKSNTFRHTAYTKRILVLSLLVSAARPVQMGRWRKGAGGGKVGGVVWPKGGSIPLHCPYFQLPSPPSPVNVLRRRSDRQSNIPSVSPSTVAARRGTRLTATKQMVHPARQKKVLSSDKRHRQELTRFS